VCVEVDLHRKVDLVCVEVDLHRKVDLVCVEVDLHRKVDLVCVEVDLHRKVDLVCAEVDLLRKVDLHGITVATTSMSEAIAARLSPLFFIETTPGCLMHSGVFFTLSSQL